MSVWTSRVPTQSGSRYLQQLCKHWSHKMTVDFTPEAGTVDFPNGSRLSMRAEAEVLQVELIVPDGEDASRMQGVVANHLDRFAFREAPLSFDWRETP